MFSKLPPVVQETLVMGAGAALGVLSANPSVPTDLASAKSLTLAVVGAVIAAEVKAWRSVVQNWLTTGKATVDNNTTPAETPAAKKN